MDEATRGLGLTRRGFLALAGGAMASLAACASGSSQPESPETPAGSESVEPKVDRNEFRSLELDNTKWSYDEEHDVYYQLGVPYCLHPGTETYETLAIYVPGAYMEGEKHGRKYTCTLLKGVRKGEFTSTGAPIALPIEAPDFAAQQPPTTYSFDKLGDFLSRGFVYVYPGLRGRSSGYDSASDDFFSGGAPWAVTDLKAVIRWLRYNDAVLPGSAHRMIAFGHGAGGGLAAIAGCTGGSELYDPYLEKIGAITHDAEGEPISDDLYAVACWCPVLPSGEANAAYEWMMGQYGSAACREDNSLEQELSRALAEHFGERVGELGLVDAEGEQLVLDETEGAMYAAGTFYDYVLAQVGEAFGAFVADAGEGKLEVVSENQRSGEWPASTLDASAIAVEPQTSSFGSLEQYLATLNTDYQWITYDDASATGRIASISALVDHLRPATRGVGGYDALARKLPTNQLFGVDEHGSLHYDAALAGLIEDNQDAYAELDGWDPAYPDSFHTDLRRKDSLDTKMAVRRRMYDPLYFLSGAYEGFGSARVAPYWRISTGILQDETTLVQELALASLLDAYDGVKGVDLQLVWNRGFAPVERAGSAVGNLSSWAAEVC